MGILARVAAFARAAIFTAVTFLFPCLFPESNTQNSENVSTHVVSPGRYNEYTYSTYHECFHQRKLSDKAKDEQKCRILTTEQILTIQNNNNTPQELLDNIK